MSPRRTRHCARSSILNEVAKRKASQLRVLDVRQAQPVSSMKLRSVKLRNRVFRRLPKKVPFLNEVAKRKASQCIFLAFIGSLSLCSSMKLRSVKLRNIRAVTPCGGSFLLNEVAKRKASQCHESRALARLLNPQ